MVDPYEILKQGKQINNKKLHIMRIATTVKGEIKNKTRCVNGQMDADRREAFGGQTVKTRIECYRIIETTRTQSKKKQKKTLRGRRGENDRRNHTSAYIYIYTHTLIKN